MPLQRSRHRAEQGRSLDENFDPVVSFRLGHNHVADRKGGHVLAMADVLSDGIMAQFPDRFSAAPPAGELSLRTSMRQAWEDHILWTRLLIVSAVSDLPDMEVALNRLLQNQVDIGNAIKPYYGDAAGEQLTLLLRDHITGAVDVLTVAANKDNAAVEAATTARHVAAAAHRERARFD